MDNLNLIRIRKRYDEPKIDDIPAEVARRLDGSGFRPQKDKTYAVATGSRGVANIAVVVKAVVDWLKSRGAGAIIVPAMGSHGGATAEGQAEVLASYGITEAAMGAPIRSSMEVVNLPDGGVGNRVYTDRIAFGTAGTILVNRIKVHTDFHSETESGIVKMGVIGLGKHAQALEIHSFGVLGLKNRILPTFRQILKEGNIVLGVALVENALDQTMIVEALLPDRIVEEEMRLLDISRAHMPSLPVEDIDLLMIDEMGKDISGVGLDPNIIGRMRVPDQQDPPSPRIRQIIVFSLTPASHGNAIGVGLADVITDRLRDSIDYHATYENVFTSSFLERGKVPVTGKTDLEALKFSLRGGSIREPEQARIIRIKNTLALEEMFVSPAVWEDLKADPAYERLGDAEPMFEGSGLRPFPAHAEIKL